MVPRFINLIAYVIYICITYNLYLFHDIYQIGQLLVQMLVLIRLIFVLVDDLTDIEIQERRLKRRHSIQMAQEAKFRNEQAPTELKKE